MTIKVVKPPKDENIYRVKCLNASCGVLIEYHQDDIRTIQTNYGIAYGISCPTCYNVINNTKLMNIRKPKGYIGFWQRIFG